MHDPTSRSYHIRRYMTSGVIAVLVGLVYAFRQEWLAAGLGAILGIAFLGHAFWRRRQDRRTRETQ